MTVLLAVGISHLQRPATTSAAQKSCQQSWSASCCALWLSHACVPSRVGANLLLVAHVLVPRNITFVVLRNHHFPLILGTSMATCLAGTTVHNRGPRVLPAPDKDSGVGRVLEHAEVPRVDRLDPGYLAVAGLA